MSVKKIVIIYAAVIVLLSGCGQKLTDITSLEKIKDIELTTKEVGTVDDMSGDLDNKAAANIAGTEVSLSCPEGWDIDIDDGNRDSRDNRIFAYHQDVPIYELEVQLEQDLCDKHYVNLANVLMATVDNLDKADAEFDKIISFIEEAYTYYLQEEAYEKWTEISSFEQQTIHEQIYVVIKGKLKINGKKRERGAYWYVTIHDGNLIVYKFMDRNANMDDSVISVFEKIMNTVAYASIPNTSSDNVKKNNEMTLDEYLNRKEKINITLKLIGAEKLKKADTITIYKDGLELDKIVEFQSDQYKTYEIELSIYESYFITSAIDKGVVISVEQEDEGKNLVFNYNRKEIYMED